MSKTISERDIKWLRPITDEVGVTLESLIGIKTGKTPELDQILTLIALFCYAEHKMEEAWAVRDIAADKLAKLLNAGVLRLSWLGKKTDVSA